QVQQIMFPKPLFKLLLIRHGQTQANVEGRFYGRTDTAMTDVGRGQVQATAERLKNYDISHVYASPANRAVETAEILNQQWQAPMTVDERLWEVDHNRWELMTAQDIAAKYPDDWAGFLSGDISKAHHGGETLDEVAVRGLSLVDELKTSLPGNGETIVFASHAGISQVLLCELMGTPKRGIWPYRFKNAGCAELEIYEFGSVLTGFQ
ncbi:MAG: histidine phosphatase family protein, partial [Chloroflexota bacterium]